MLIKSLPFKNLNADAWRKLALAAVAFLYIANFIALILKIGIMNGVGGDYWAYWSAGRVARELGFSHIYDLNIIGQVQYQTITNTNLPPDILSPILIPYLYLSFFVIPFYFLSFLDFPSSFWLWTVVNILALAFHLSLFMRDLSKSRTLQSNQKLLLMALLVSYPVYANLINGQIELLNVIFCGEFLRHAINKRPVISGLWLGGLLIKPQMLILVVLALFLMKNWKILQGFVISAVGILITSFCLSGVKGSLDLFKLWTDTDQLNSSFAPENMANWRMIGVNINTWTSSSQGWILTILGTLVTLALWISLIKKKPAMLSSQWIAVLLSIFSASCLISWHSHIHTAMVLLPFLVFLAHRQVNNNSQRIIDFFVFSFPIAWIIGSIISILLVIFHKPPVENLTNFLLGFAGVVVYSYIILAIIKTKPQVELSKDPFHDQSMIEQ